MRLVVVFFTLLLPLVAGDPISISGIPKGAVLKVEHSSAGCFHSTRSFFEFTGNRVRIWEEQFEVDLQDGGAKRVKKLVGEMKLTARDIEELDLLCDYYQGSPDGGCTTVEKVWFSLQKDGKVLREEKHTDASCRLMDVKGLLPFDELAGRCAEKGTNIDQVDDGEKGIDSQLER